MFGAARRAGAPPPAADRSPPPPPRRAPRHARGPPREARRGGAGDRGPRPWLGLLSRRTTIPEAGSRTALPLARAPPSLYDSVPKEPAPAFPAPLASARPRIPTVE